MNAIEMVLSFRETNRKLSADINAQLFEIKSLLLATLIDKEKLGYRTTAKENDEGRRDHKLTLVGWYKIAKRTGYSKGKYVQDIFDGSVIATDVKWEVEGEPDASETGTRRAYRQAITSRLAARWDAKHGAVNAYLQSVTGYELVELTTQRAIEEAMKLTGQRVHPALYPALIKLHALQAALDDGARSADIKRCEEQRAANWKGLKALTDTLETIAHYEFWRELDHGVRQAEGMLPPW